MATLYFSGVGGADWSDTSRWYFNLNSNGSFSSPANRIPNSSDTAIICGSVGNVSGDYTNPAILQLGTATPFIYKGEWLGDFELESFIYFTFPIVNLVNNGLSGYGNQNFFLATASGYGASYTIGTMNLRGHSAFSGNASITTANFYDYSVNGGHQDAGTITCVSANFYDYSSNGAGGVDGDNNGTIFGNVIFNNHSSNCPQGGGDGYSGTIYGNVIFNDYSRNAIADNNNDNIYIGTIFGNATFNNNSSNGNVDTSGGGYTTATGHVYGYSSSITYTSTTSYAETLQAGAYAATITMPATSISQSKVYLNELLQLPFPVVIQ